MQLILLAQNLFQQILFYLLKSFGNQAKEISRFDILHSATSRATSNLFFSQKPAYFHQKYGFQFSSASLMIIFMTTINKLRSQCSKYLFEGRLQQGFELIKCCLQIQPNTSDHHVNKALFQWKFGRTQIALSDLKKALTLDYLNYKAYFNLFSIQARQKKLDEAFKQICCCLSLAYLAKARKENSMEAVDKSIDFSYNNKQARALKSILKLKEKKNIEALNQINYALYLEPGHQSLKIIQNKVYKTVGMREFTSSQTPNSKPKYSRLQTNKESPQPDKIQAEVKILLKQFNQLLKYLNNKDLFHLKGKDFIKNETTEQRVVEEKVPSPKFYIVTRSRENTSQEVSNVSFETCFKAQKQSTTNNSAHIDLSLKQDPKIGFQKGDKLQHFFSIDSCYSNKSISNISQNSNINWNRVSHGQEDSFQSRILNESQGSSLFLESYQGNQSNILSQNASLNDGKKVKLPLMVKQLANNQKLMVTLQRTITNDKGENQIIQETYEVIQSKGNKLQLIKPSFHIDNS